jgi:hypothetical protein
MKTYAASLLLLLFCAHDARAADCWKSAEHAQELERAGQLRAARAEALACARPECHEAVRRDCTAFLERFEASQPTIVVRVDDSRGSDVVKAKVFIDDELVADTLQGLPMALDPGPHSVRVEVGGARAEKTVVVALREKERVVALHFDVPMGADGTLLSPSQPGQPHAGPNAGPAPAASDTAEAPAKSVHPAAYVLTGIGAAGLLTFGAVEVVAQSGLASIRDGCGRTKSCSAAELDPLRAQFAVAAVALGTGLVAGAASLFFWLRPTSDRAPQVSAAFGPSSVGVQVRSPFLSCDWPRTRTGRRRR